MASRQNLTGRKGGFGRGPLSKVYGKAQKLAQGARDVGAAPGSPLSRVARKRGGLMKQLKEGAQRLNPGEKSAPGIDQLTGGGPLETANLAPPPEVTAAVQPGGAVMTGDAANRSNFGMSTRRGRPAVRPQPEAAVEPVGPTAPSRRPRGPRRRPTGAMVPRSTRPQQAAIAPAASLTPQIPGTAAGTPALPPQSEAANIAVTNAPNQPTANAPGGRSVRSRGLHRSGAVPPRTRGL